MRPAHTTALAVAACLLVPAAAAAQPTAAPPSKTLERAIKLYDKEDHYSASIELTKVTSGESGDDPPNVARAEFFTAKNLVRLGFHASSLTWFQKTVPPHTYQEAAMKWLVDQMEKRPNESTRQLIQSYPPEIVDAPMLSDEDRAWVAYFRGYHLVRTDANQAAAEQLLSRVPAGSPPWARAQLALGELSFRHNDVDRGVAHALAAAADPAVSVDAVRSITFWTRSLGKPAAARDALAKIATGADAGAGAAALELSRLEATRKLALLEKGGVAAFEAVMLAAVCPDGRSDDALAAVAAVAQHAIQVFDKLATYQDDAALSGAAERLITAPATPADGVLGVLLDDPDGREILGWNRELAAELELLGRSDKAWQTTMTAAEIMQELTIHRAMAEADTGKLIRIRMNNAMADLRALAGAAAGGPKLTAGPSDATLIVTPAFCAAALGIQPPETTDTQALPTTTTTRPHGCGCTTTTSSSATAAAGPLAVILAAALASRRRRRVHLSA